MIPELCVSPPTMEYFAAKVLFIIALLLYCVRRRLAPRTLRIGDLPYPPGPRPIPLIGNFRQIPKSSPWITYAKWRKTYGEVISLEAMGNRVVIVNSARAAADIFDKKGGIYSDRPHNVMIQELMKFENVIFLSYTDRFRAQRKLLNTAFNPAAVADYIPTQEREVHDLLFRLMETPEDFYKHVRRAVSSVMLTIGYGHHVDSDDDYFVKLGEATIRLVRSALHPGSFYVNMLPALKHIPTWFPLASFHRQAQRGHQMYKNFREVPFEMVKSQMAAGNAPISYISKHLEATGSLVGREDEERNIQESAAALFGAGTDATIAIIVTFILAMVLHPEVQRRVQAELDSIVGNSRLPTVADKSALPYLNCVTLEVLRWQPVTALGVPRELREDDVYNGYFIPKGSIVMSNIWAMTHDDELYTDPMKFWPERFDGRFPGIHDPSTLVFGFGRRLCPGRHLAANSIFLALASLVSCFNFSKVRDAQGEEEDPLVDYSGGLPANFKCQITPRSPDAITVIKGTQGSHTS